VGCVTITVRDRSPPFGTHPAIWSVAGKSFCEGMPETPLGRNNDLCGPAEPAATAHRLLPAVITQCAGSATLTRRFHRFMR